MRARTKNSRRQADGATKPEQRFVPMGSGFFLDRKTGHVVAL